MEHKDAGNKLFVSGDLAGAKEAYQRGIDTLSAIPDDQRTSEQRAALVALLSNQSHILLKLDAADAAEQLASRAIELDVFWAKAYSRRGAARVALKKFDAAVQDFRRVALLDPQLREGSEALIAEALRLKRTDTCGSFTPNAWSTAQRDAQRRLGTCYAFAMPQGPQVKKCYQSDGSFDYSRLDPDDVAWGPADAFMSINPLAKYFIKQTWTEANRTGNTGDVCALYSTLIRETRLFDTSEGPEHFTERVILAQLRAEFPHVPDPSKPPVAEAIEKRSEPATEDTKVTYQQMHDAKGEGRYIYPGRPRWLDWPKAFHAFDIAQAKGSGKALHFVEHMAGGISCQRDMDDNMYRREQAYDGRRNVRMPLSRHLQIHRRCGFRMVCLLKHHQMITYDKLHEMSKSSGGAWRHVPPPGKNRYSNDVGPPLGTAANDPPVSWLGPLAPRKCEGCSAPLRNIADPCECRCGEQYCSDRCHKHDWKKGHKRVCEMVASAMKTGLNVSEWYWGYVMSGALPDPTRVDFVGIWRRRWGMPIIGTKDVLDGPTAPYAGLTAEDKVALKAATAAAASLDDGLRGQPVDFARAELAFYHQYERPYLANRVGALQDAFKAGVQKLPESDDGESTADDGVGKFIGELQLQRLRASTPHNLDSVARLVFKLGMNSVFEHMSSTALPFLRDEQFTKERVATAFAPFIRIAGTRDNVPNPQNALGPYAHDPSVDPDAAAVAEAQPQRRRVPMSRDMRHTFFQGFARKVVPTAAQELSAAARRAANQLTVGEQLTTQTPPSLSTLGWIVTIVTSIVMISWRWLWALTGVGARRALNTLNAMD